MSTSSSEWVIQVRSPTHYRWLAQGGNWTAQPSEAQTFSREGARKGARLIQRGLQQQGRPGSLQVQAVPLDVATGCAVAFTVASTTGTEVLLYRPGVYEDDPDAHWMLVCTDHGGCIGWATRREAERFLAYPHEWCPTCKESRP